MTLTRRALAALLLFALFGALLAALPPAVDGAAPLPGVGYDLRQRGLYVPMEPT